MTGTTDTAKIGSKASSRVQRRASASFFYPSTLDTSEMEVAPVPSLSPLRQDASKRTAKFSSSTTKKLTSRGSLPDLSLTGLVQGPRKQKQEKAQQQEQQKSSSRRTVVIGREHLKISVLSPKRSKVAVKKSTAVVEDDDDLPPRRTSDSSNKQSSSSKKKRSPSSSKRTSSSSRLNSTSTKRLSSTRKEKEESSNIHRRSMETIPKTMHDSCPMLSLSDDSDDEDDALPLAVISKKSSKTSGNSRSRQNLGLSSSSEHTPRGLSATTKRITFTRASLSSRLSASTYNVANTSSLKLSSSGSSKELKNMIARAGSSSNNLTSTSDHHPKIRLSRRDARGRTGRVTTNTPVATMEDEDMHATPPSTKPIRTRRRSQEARSSGNTLPPSQSSPSKPSTSSKIKKDNSSASLTATTNTSTRRNRSRSRSRTRRNTARRASMPSSTTFIAPTTTAVPSAASLLSPGEKLFVPPTPNSRQRRAAAAGLNGNSSHASSTNRRRRRQGSDGRAALVQALATSSSDLINANNGQATTTDEALLILSPENKSKVWEKRVASRRLLEGKLSEHGGSSRSSLPTTFIAPPQVAV